MTRERLANRRTSERDPGATAVRTAPNGAGGAIVAREMLALQRLVGNQVAVAQAGRIQAKLLVGSAYDPAERQADEIAHQVMRHLNGGGGGGGDEGAGQLDEEMDGSPALRRVAAPEMDAPIGLAGGELSSDITNTIQAERGRGHALPPPVLQPFERAFGADLSGVRVHHDAKSTQLNQAVSARAFTIGSDIFLGAGQYRPSSPDGQELLAHEVTHTIQQGR